MGIFNSTLYKNIQNNLGLNKSKPIILETDKIKHKPLSRVISTETKQFIIKELLNGRDYNIYSQLKDKSKQLIFYASSPIVSVRNTTSIYTDNSSSKKLLYTIHQNLLNALEFSFYVTNDKDETVFTVTRDPFASIAMKMQTFRILQDSKELYKVTMVIKNLLSRDVQLVFTNSAKQTVALSKISHSGFEEGFNSKFTLKCAPGTDNLMFIISMIIIDKSLEQKQQSTVHGAMTSTFF